MGCFQCGKAATKLNSQGLPVCPQHANSKLSPPTCQNCKLEMVLRESKFGKFWGCRAFPMCDGVKKL